MIISFQVSGFIKTYPTAYNIPIRETIAKSSESTSDRYNYLKGGK